MALRLILSVIVEVRTDFVKLSNLIRFGSICVFFDYNSIYLNFETDKE